MKANQISSFLLLFWLVPVSGQEWQLFMTHRETGVVREARSKAGVVAYMQDNTRAAGHMSIPNDSTLEIGGNAYPLRALRSLTTGTRQNQTTGGIIAGLGGVLIAAGVLIGATGEHGADNALGSLESTVNWGITAVMAGTGLVMVVAGAKTASPKKFTVDSHEFIIRRR